MPDHLEPVLLRVRADQIDGDPESGYSVPLKAQGVEYRGYDLRPISVVRVCDPQVAEIKLKQIDADLVIDENGGDRLVVRVVPVPAA